MLVSYTTETGGAMESEGLIAETTRRILGDLADPQAVNKAGDGWKAPAWSALEEAGLTLAWVPETLGGAGAETVDGFAVLRQAGRFAAAIPLAETLLAGWLLSQAGLRVPAGTLTVAPVREGDTPLFDSKGNVTGHAHAVPFARDADHIVFIAQKVQGSVVALVPRANCRPAPIW